jgi:hypothetical protein
MFIRGSVGGEGSRLDFAAMARHSVDDDHDDDEEDREAPDASDRDADDEEDYGDTVDCPRCGREISEYAQRCPRCGAYVSDEEARRTNFPVWVIVTAAALVAAFVLGWLRGIF